MKAMDLDLKVNAYVSLREALGFRPRMEGLLLHDFVRHVESQGAVQPIRAQTALEWACSGKRGLEGRSHLQRLDVVRGFLSHLRATIPETEVPDRGLVASTRRPKPYIFSPLEIEALISAAKGARPRGSLRPHTLATLIGLLASTGLRSGEALRLTMADVQLNLTPPRLQIWNSKFHKSRLVPLHATTTAMLDLYIHKRRDFHCDQTSGSFFLSHRGIPLTAISVMHWFRKTTRKLGLRSKQGGPRPILNSLRHTFAVNRILMWYQEGTNVLPLLPNLSVYMGHLRPQESYWYLSATPELLAAAADRFRAYTCTGGES
jgi:site-specific recombinase XerD